MDEATVKKITFNDGVDAAIELLRKLVEDNCRTDEPDYICEPDDTQLQLFNANDDFICDTDQLIGMLASLKE